MSAALIDKASAKINLTLRVLGRRADGYHELESLVAFADVADTLTLQPANETTLDVKGPFARASGAVSDNLVLKAFSALSQRVPGLAGGRFSLEKNLPVAGGVGGGSADAAAALRLLARANDLALDDPRLMQAALAVGADVPVCLAARACVMRGMGEHLSPPIDLPELDAVLVNPGAALATRDVFARVKAASYNAKSLGDVPLAPDALIAFLNEHGNDLVDAAVACVPSVADVLAALRTSSGVRLARMSGSGPTCFALFATQDEAAAAAQQLAAAHPSWWVRRASLGAGRP